MIGLATVLSILALLASLFALGEQFYGKWFFGYVPKLKAVPNEVDAVEPVHSNNTLTFRLPDPIFIDAAGGTAYISLKHYIEVPKGTVGIVSLSSSLARQYPEVFVRTLILPEGYKGDLAVFIGNRGEEVLSVESKRPLVNVTLIPSFYKTGVKKI